MSAQRLYTPQLLAAAVELARWPALPDAALKGEARSPACGSTLRLDLDLSDAGRIERVGLLVRACAVGQGAAAIFARHATGRTAADIAAAREALAGWLAGEGELPAWPDLDLVAAARDYPGRHGAIMLPWNAALAALSTAAAAG